MVRICKKCKQEKDISEFLKDNRVKGGYTYSCLKCVAEYKNRHYQDNKERYVKRAQEHYCLNIEKTRALSKEKWARCKNDPEFMKEKSERRKRDYQRDKEKERLYKQQNKERFRERNNISANKRRANSVLLQLSSSISANMRHSLKEKKEGKHWEELVEYTTSMLKTHLEQLFQPGMSWANYGRGKGKWNIDHKIPITWFKYDSYEHPDFKKCWALFNLQPKWALENISKGNRYSD